MSSFKPSKYSFNILDTRDSKLSAMSTLLFSNDFKLLTLALTIQNIFGRSSYNLPYTVSHISCFLQGESQVQPPKYKIQTHTHTYKYNRLSFKSKNPPEINMAIEPNPKPSCLRQQATPLSALVAILVGVLVGLLVRWLPRCRLDHQ